MKKITDKTFEEDVLHSDRPTVVDFWAAWCQPCYLVAPELQKLEIKYSASIDFVSLDVEENPLIPGALGIQSLPTIALFVKGKEPKALIGAMSAEVIEVTLGLDQYAPSLNREKSLDRALLSPEKEKDANLPN